MQGRVGDPVEASDTHIGTGFFLIYSWIVNSLCIQIFSGDPMQMFSQVFGNNGLFTEFNFGGPEGADVSVYAYVLCKQKQAKL